ncbi:MAG: VCBS repeat-containing protein, partial [Candidatus Hydrogenedentes bacterium]|nr:VCBS repeat-containing protein [Candidatus Hydrogenedentota bacterium]
DVAVEDVDGDGRHDVVASCAAKEDAAPCIIVVYLQSEQGGLPKLPSITLTLPVATGVVMFVQMNGEGPRELVAAHSTGAAVHACRDGALAEQSVLEFNSLFPSAVKEPLILDYGLDLDGEGSEEWLLPVSRGFQLWRGAQPVAELRADVSSQIRRGSSVSVSHVLPDFAAFSLPDQQNKALAFLSRQYLDFAYGDDWSESRRLKLPHEEDSEWNWSAQMEDLNGDELPDLVVTESTGSVNVKMRVSVYHATAPFTYPAKPGTVLESAGALASPYLQDVNGDGKNDLIMIKIPFSVKTFVNYFLRQRVNVQLEAYLSSSTGIESQASLSQSITVSAPDDREQIAYAMGDFNGDSRLDLALGSGEDALEVHLGGETRFVEPKPWLQLNLPSLGLARPYDIDGNAAEDLIIFHPDGQKSTRIEVVLF